MVRRAAASFSGLLLILGLVTLLPAAAGAVATDLLADWQMNESAGAATMVDGSGNGINGAIGDAVVTGYEVMGATAYHWTNTQPNLPPAKPERLVQVNDARLNPQSDDYAITVRFRTTRPFGNIIQKGQSGNLGGNWKWQIPNGQLGCTFRGYDENGTELQKTVNSGSPDIPQFDPLNDGEWHTVRCERRGDQLIMTVNVGTPDEYVRRANGPTGHISNNVPLTIGGKVNCTGLPGITCDYFVGDIDFVQIHTGPREPVDTPPTASASADCDYLECSFSSAGSVDPDGGALDYSWDFGDGRMSTQPNPVHTYDAPGDYRVELTVTDDENDDDADVVNLDVQTAPPVAAFDVTCDFLECTFDASDSIDPDGTIVDYEWDFGDDAGGSGESAVHTYSDTGSYDVALTVTDNHGATDMITGAVAAEAAPPVHVHWLIASPWDRDGDKWVARVIVRMRDGDENPHAGVGVTVRFGANKERSCVTGANGNCVVKVKVNDSRAKIPAEVIAVDWAGGYDPSMNHDIDGDGDGESVMVYNPIPPVHVHWLIASPWDRDGDKWVARVIVRMRDGDENPHAGVGVTVRFGANKERSCVTGANGNCVVKVKVNDSRAKIPAEVIAVDWAGGYDPSMNHDIDGDGDGETVVVLRPF